MGADMRSFYPGAGAQTAFFLRGGPGNPGSQSVLGNTVPQKGDTARSPTQPGQHWVATGIAGYGSGPSGGQTMTWRYDGPPEAAPAAAPAPAPAAPPPPPAPSGTPAGPTVSEAEAKGEPGPWSLQGGKKEDVVRTPGFLDQQLARTDTDYEKWLNKQPTPGSSTGNSDWDRYFKNEYTEGKPLETRAKDHNKGGRRMAAGGDFLSDLHGIASLGNPSKVSL